jgi:hypothetical protein
MTLTFLTLLFLCILIGILSNNHTIIILSLLAAATYFYFSTTFDSWHTYVVDEYTAAHDEL